MKTLERIIDSAKKVGRKSMKFAKDNAKTMIMVAGLSAGAYFLNETNKEAQAGTIQMANMTDNLSIDVSMLAIRNIDEATAGYGFGDISFTTSPYENALEISTTTEGVKLSTNADSITTSGWDFDLGVKGSVSEIDNYLRYKITDTTDLVGKTLTMYDKAIPDVKYPLLMDSAYHNIPLPSLTSGTGEYANWRLDVIPEPATIALLGLGTLALGTRKKKERKLLKN